MEFNSDSAFKYIERQCEIGPRYPGSLGHKKLINYLNDHFSTYADTVEIFNDIILHPVTNEEISISNFLIRSETYELKTS